MTTTTLSVPKQRSTSRTGQARTKDAPAVEVTGLLDQAGRNTVIRTNGYLPGPKDVTVPAALVDALDLRRGDHVRGVAQNGLLTSVAIVNGEPVETARPHFADLVPIYPDERLRLETTRNILTTRVIDLFAPIGKGQRGLIVAPPKAGKTMLLKAVANAITTNHPECHLMVVLVDERPEEVTDMRASVRAEVIASTFDRAPQDHITAAELAVERAKRLVEAGRDVVVLIDSITRLGRAYNMAAPSGGRVLTGGMDAGALHQPKKVLGAARNIEGGGSLTILATALVETGSKMDDNLFEEFKSTGNMELKLSRSLADRRIFPAVDVVASGTRREELLFDPAELPLTRRLRRALHEQESIESFLTSMKNTGSNAELLLALRRA
ncbi:transcription termination factor Rho [Microbispora sp. SCL1-1]|jgi:transcription termination factor Rho|uniref:transcription termination factor Rho n=1 Tax=Microbispora TaxID=2005 RepID=UPI001158FAF4|nr:transcription termination factor Rho [Microbispora sp. CL1-1]TQS06554.1 transcription termination factor Rho [Microbispora sp. SCL1-1]